MGGMVADDREFPFAYGGDPEVTRGRGRPPDVDLFMCCCTPV